jgi:hypothetical protein
MIKRAGNSSALWIVVLCLTIVPLSCSQGTIIAGSFVGPTEGSESFVAIVTNGEQVMGYVCDGATTAEWFTGAAARDSIDLTSAGSIGLVAQRGTGDTLDGTLTTAGTESSFSAMRVDIDGSEGGLCRGILQVDGVTYTGGWIVLPDGRQRGAVIGDDGSKLFGVPDIDPVTMIVDVPGLGTFNASAVAPADL